MRAIVDKTGIFLRVAKAAEDYFFLHVCRNCQFYVSIT